MKNLIFILLLLVSFTSHCQNETIDCIQNTSSQSIISSAQDEIIARENSIRNQRSSSNSWPSVTIPVVFNIIHSGLAKEPGYYDLKTKAGCEWLIQTANLYFEEGRIVPGDPDPGQSDANITFVLADKDINGNPFDGYRTFNVKDDYKDFIDYVGATDVYVAESSKDIVDFFAYEKEHYLNVFVIQLNGNISGWSWVPPTENRGLFLNSKKFKGFKGTTFVHEIGHFFGLYHTFEGYDACSEALSEVRCDMEGDLVCDTGPTKISSVCGDVCGSIVDEQPNNFMSYSHTRCQNSAFTDGQIDRMHAIIQLYFSDMANHGQVLYGTN